MMYELREWNEQLDAYKHLVETRKEARACTLMQMIWWKPRSGSSLA